jgi:crotonobetainyl-CoA:carnitine CoA-transferase CaiB-like acyl-CoA transferase
MLHRADAVVWSPGSRLADLPALAPAALLDAAPHLTVTAITPFGLEGPWSDHPATEFTLQAWSGGAVGLGRGAPDRAPVSVGGQIGEWFAGAYAAVGTMVSRTRARRDGPGELVDLSMLETLVLSLTYYPVTYADMVGRPFRTGRSIVTPGVEATSDGLVGVGVGTGQQWLDFCVLVDHPEWTEDRKLFANRGHLKPDIAAWMAEHTTAEVLDLAGALRIPHARIGTGETIPATDHFQARGSIVKNPRGGFDEPDRPYRFDPPLLRDPEPAPRLGEHDAIMATACPEAPEEGRAAALPMEGLRVLDLTAFWAGPLCTHVMAMLGAEVLHIESTARPDGTRLLAGIRFSEPDWWEQSGIFSGLNAGKRSVTLDLGTDRGRELLHRLLETCDVLVENYTPRVLE